MTSTVLLLNASFQVLGRIPWERAVTSVALGEAEVFEAVPDKTVHSQHLEIPWPSIIRLLQYVHVPHTRRRNPEGPATRSAIMRRDGRRCAYCGGSGDTLDHVWPRSRGGLSDALNLVCCCGPCNRRKGNRSPAEAGMPMLWPPRPIEPEAHDQQYVWDLLARAAG